ncbi:MAG: phosphoadenosine phosphosulfate reductase family protein [Paludibacter sp.]|nr:phosphoadenosine phosphosulfate reductase family protein [Paludibacter sp.]
MNFQIKKCLFCETFKPLGLYHSNPASKDGYWGWCKECEKRYGYSQKKLEINGKCNYIVSFSGGKDSTAMLLKLIEEKRRIDAVVYFDCGSFEWPQMAGHIERIEKDTGIKIIKIHPFMDFYEQAITLLPGNKSINGWPTPMLRWCTMQKINLIKQAMRPFRPYVQYIGFSSDENDRVLKASISGNNVKRDHFMNNEFPLVEWGMTEADCLKYCFEKGYDWGGLYNYFSRVSCWCCPLQNQTDLAKLCKHFPDMWKRLKAWDQAMPEPYKKDPTIFEKIEQRVYFAEAGGQP